VSIITKRKDGRFQFKSETELENFVYIHLDKLLDLSPITRQYRIGIEICDILATGDRNNLGIIELKNVEDRYIVQQLTRYYDGLIQNKPKINGIDYRKPAKLIAIAPSFHSHNFIDRKYSKLNIDFFTFAIVADRATGNIFLELTDVETEVKHMVQIPDVKRNTMAKSQESAKVEIDNNEMIDYYMRLNYSSKLGLDSLNPEQLRKQSEIYRSKCTRQFKIIIEYVKKTEIIKKSVTVKLPSKVKIDDFYQWCWKNITGGKEGIKAKHRSVSRTPAGVFKIRIWLFDIYKRSNSC
jgi:Endonuclease NucS